jgi:hypothetical protein
MLPCAMLRLFLFLLLASGLFSRACADPDAPPSLPTLIQAVIARDEATQKQLHTMQYEQSNHTEELDAKGTVSKEQDLHLLVRPGAPQEIQVLSIRGDNLPSDPDEAMQKAKGQEIERRQHNFSLKNLVARFNIAYAGTTDYLGQKAYLLTFEPKPNQPYHDQTEKVLDQLHGRMWVSAKDDVVLQTDATLTQPVPVAWIFARISALHFHYELRSTSSDFGPAFLQVGVEVNAPLIDIRQRQTVDMTHFESRGKLASAKNP